MQASGIPAFCGNFVARASSGDDVCMPCHSGTIHEGVLVARAVAKVAVAENMTSSITFDMISSFGDLQSGSATDAFGAAQHSGISYLPLLKRVHIQHNKGLAPIHSRNSFESCGDVLIPGGLGSLGSLVARFIALQANHVAASPYIWLLGRSTRFAQHAHHTFIKSSHVPVTLLSCDSSSSPDVEQLTHLMGAKHSPLLSIHHTAGVLTVSDGPSFMISLPVIISSFQFLHSFQLPLYC